MRPCIWDLNFEAKGEYIMTWYGSDGWVSSTSKVGTRRPATNWQDWIWNCRSSTTWNWWAAMITCTTGWEPKPSDTRPGFIYYITNTLLFEGDYEFLNSNDPAQTGPTHFAAFPGILKPAMNIAIDNTNKQQPCIYSNS